MALLTCLRKYSFQINVFLLILLCRTSLCNLPEQGIFEVKLKQLKIKDKSVKGVYQGFISRPMYGGSKISFDIPACGVKEPPFGQIELQWVIRGAGCHDAYNSIDDSTAFTYYSNVGSEEFSQSKLPYNISYQLDCKDPSHLFNCQNNTLLQECNSEFIEVALKRATTAAPPKKTSAPKAAPTEKKPVAAVRRKRAAETKKPEATTPKATIPKKVSHMYETQLGKEMFSVYLIVIHSNEPNVTVKVKIHHDNYGYISPSDYPLLVVYGILCCAYIIYSIIWLILLAFNWKDLLRLQYWISAVIALGLLEKAMFISEYDSVYKTGKSVRGAVIVAAGVSCLKRALARMLILIASVGFGIVKPRLGPMLKKVLGVGLLYFIVACVAAGYNMTLKRINSNKSAMYAEFALIIIDFGLVWWIFSNLITTLRTLRLRRNVVKLSVYRHFTHTITAAVLISVAFLIWFVITQKYYPSTNKCIMDSSLYWLDEAFWPILFTGLLLVIIILWRPTTNNQRYAFSPLLDNADDDDEESDEEEIVMNDAYEGLKSRGAHKEKATKKDPQTKADEDLKWVEDNIPSSIVDRNLVINSDDEKEQTRLEMAKMD